MWTIHTAKVRDLSDNKSTTTTVYHLILDIECIQFVFKGDIQGVAELLDSILDIFNPHDITTPTITYHNIYPHGAIYIKPHC